jgi:cytochrome d ubiquinol oxidase subunit II
MTPYTSILTDLALVFMGISLLLYVLLGGADFGAGIIEIFTGKRGINTISKAIAPVWEANHIWLIVVIVILFNAFPKVYSTVTLYLHIPLMLVLLGIIFRGTAFTFRYYDPYEDTTHKLYTFVFKLFSLLTPFFLGITMGAVISGELTLDHSASFYDRFLAPWLGFFPVAVGLFIIVLFAYLASVYLAGELESGAADLNFGMYSKRLLFALVIAGGIVFLSAGIDGIPLFNRFLHSWISVGAVIVATLLLPAFFYALKKGMKDLTRLMAGAQTAAILTGWFGIQFPDLVELKNAEALTIYNCVAPDKTLLMMIVALVVGLAVVIPLLIYLFKVFKFEKI